MILNPVEQFFTQKFLQIELITKIYKMFCCYSTSNEVARSRLINYFFSISTSNGCSSYVSNHTVGSEIYPSFLLWSTTKILITGTENFCSAFCSGLPISRSRLCCKSGLFYLCVRVFYQKNQFPNKTFFALLQRISWNELIESGLSSKWSCSVNIETDVFEFSDKLIS